MSLPAPWLLPKHPTLPFSSVPFSHSVRLSATPQTTAGQASLSITNSRSLLKLLSTESVMPSNHLILCRPLLLLPSVFPSIRVSQLFASGGQCFGVSASASVLPVNIQDCFPLGLTDWISLKSKGPSRDFSSITVQRHQFFSTQPFLLFLSTSVRDYWKNHSFDYMELCWQSDASTF